MRLTSRKFSIESFPGQEWISALLSPLNTFIQEVYQGFSNGLSVEDNLFQEIKEIRFVNNIANLPISFLPKFSSRPKGLYIIYCEASDGTALSGAPWATWSLTSDGRVSISNITGLISNKTYSLRILVIYG